MTTRFLMAAALAVLAGCSGNSPSAPDGGGGPTGGGTGGPAPSTAAVTVGNIFFKSGQDGTTNPAQTTVAVGGTVTFPGPGDPSITARSATLGDPISPGSVRFYQTYYRDPSASFCPSATFNVSSAIEIHW